jgi:hypothetical protein
MTTNPKTSNALTIVDGFDDNAGATNSPLRGIAFRFKDGEYLAFSDEFPTEGRTFAVIDKADGWQKLAEGIPPEYLMRQPGQVRPPRPHVDEADWPTGFDGKPSHPWVLTRFLYLLDTATGEVSTFYSGTVGGRVAFDELSDQVKVTRSAQPDAIPVITLESKDMPTKFGGVKPRPYFKIAGYKLRSNIGSQNLLTDETKAAVEATKPSDNFSDPLPDFAPPKPVKASNGKRAPKSEAA